MAHSSKQLYKVDKDQQIHQALSVLEAVVECGIAGICRDRRLFPESFFISRDTGSQTKVTQFNMAVLRESSQAESQKDNTTSTLHQVHSDRSRNDSSGVGSTHRDFNERIDDNERKSSNHRVEKKKGSECTSVLDDHYLSPLTSSACIESSSLNSCHSPENSIAIASHSRNEDNYHSHYTLLQAEALLLLYWVRQGVIQVMKEGKLARLVFGICQRGDDKEGKKRADIYAGVRDRIVESYAFDISKLPKTPSGSLNQTQVQSAFDTVFRNLESFSSTISPILQSMTTSATNISSHQNVPPSCFSMSSILSPERPDALSLTKQRYFIIRVEFTDYPTLPQALDPKSSPINTMAYMDEEKQKETVEPSIVDTLNSHVPTSLGQVVDKNATGLGVRITAYTNDEFELDKKRKRKIRDSNDWFVENKCVQKRTLSRRSSIELTKDKYSQFMQEHCKQDKDLIEGHSRAFAIPHVPRGHNHGLLQYLPCKIIDSRITKKDLVNYKVVFFDEELIRAKMKKQWVSYEKVISEKKLIRKIRSMGSISSADFQKELAKKLKINHAMIGKIVSSLLSSREWKLGIESTEEANELHNDDERCIKLPSPGMKSNGRFSFIINPIKAVI